MPNEDQLRLFIQLFDDDAMFDLVAEAIADSRDQAPRRPDDRDSGQVLDDVIAAVRRKADAA